MDNTPSTIHIPLDSELPLELNNSIPKHNHFKIVVLGNFFNKIKLFYLDGHEAN